MLDRGYSPPDVDRSRRHGLTVEEQHAGETIDERIAHTALRYEPPGVCSRSLAFVKSSNHASRYPVPNDRGS